MRCPLTPTFTPWLDLPKKQINKCLIKTGRWTEVQRVGQRRLGTVPLGPMSVWEEFEAEGRQVCVLGDLPSN